MWRETILEIEPEAAFAEPATEDALREAQRVLGRPFPDALLGVLRESDGVTGSYGSGLVWSVDRIVEENLELRGGFYRAYYMPFEPLLFFADAGNGDLFAFVREPERADVFAWDHEDDSRRWVAPDLETYVRWWESGDIVL